MPRQSRGKSGEHLGTAKPGCRSSFCADGEPDRRLIGVGPLHSVTNVRREFDVVARGKYPRRGFAFDHEARRTCEDDDPLRPVLVVPEAGRARLPRRDDPLDAGAGKFSENRGLLDVRARWNLFKEAPAAKPLSAHAWLWARACSTRIAVSIFSSPPLCALRVIAPSWPSKPTATRM